MRNLPSRVLSRLRWEAHRGAVLAETLFATRWHDLVLARRNLVTQGDLPCGTRAALYVIYPTTGLLASHLIALDYMAGRGYAPVVISNLPLDAQARSQLRSKCHLLIERQNFGYDFGAYRQGVLALADRLPELDYLAFLNDSVWFPLDGTDWLAEAEALDTDLAGAVSNYGVAQPGLADYAGAGWDYDPQRPDFHYCSYALLLSGKILRDPGFLHYWRRYRLTSNKIRTVRRGEVGFSQWALSRGHRHGATLDVAHLDQRLAALGTAELYALLATLVIPEETALRALKHQVLAAHDGSAAWHRDALAFVLTAVARTGLAYALPDFVSRQMGGGFLKKSPLRLEPEGAAITQAILERMEGARSAVFRDEALAMQPSKRTTG